MTRAHGRLVALMLLLSLVLALGSGCGGEDPGDGNAPQDEASSRAPESTGRPTSIGACEVYSSPVCIYQCRWQLYRNVCGYNCKCTETCVFNWLTRSFYFPVTCPSESPYGDASSYGGEGAGGGGGGGGSSGGDAGDGGDK